MRSAQMLLDGTDEAPTNKTAGLREFRRVSEAESGLLHPAQAALVLNVSNQRVLELIATKRLRAWEFWGRKYLSVRELADRASSDIKTGRPKRSLVQRVKATGKTLAMMDGAQVASAVLE